MFLLTPVQPYAQSCRGPMSSDGLARAEERCELHGAQALLLLLPAPGGLEADEQDVHLLSALLQLKQLQQASSWHRPLPLALLVPGPEDEDMRPLEEGEAAAPAVHWWGGGRGKDCGRDE